MSIMSHISIAVAIGACKAYPLPNYESYYINMYSMAVRCVGASCDFCVVGARRVFFVRRNVNEKWFRRVPRGTREDPKNPRFWPAKKSPLPPAKSAQKVHFRGEKRAFLTDLCTK